MLNEFHIKPFGSAFVDSPSCLYLCEGWVLFCIYIVHFLFNNRFTHKVPLMLKTVTGRFEFVSKGHFNLKGWSRMMTASYLVLLLMKLSSAVSSMPLYFMWWSVCRKYYIMISVNVSFKSFEIHYEAVTILDKPVVVWYSKRHLVTF